METEAENQAPTSILVRGLSFHADYGCQNTGVCCASGWEIPVETNIELILRPRLATLAARLPNGPDGFRSASNPPQDCKSALRRVGTSRDCWFHDPKARLCAIHRELGPESLPSA